MALICTLFLYTCTLFASPLQVPLLSPLAGLPESEHSQLTLKIQNAGDVVVQAKAGKGSATLSMAAAAA